MLAENKIDNIFLSIENDNLLFYNNFCLNFINRCANYRNGDRF